MAAPAGGSRRYKDGDLVRWYKSKMVKVDEGVDEAMKVAGELGERVGKELINTRGTGRVWSRPAPSGRIASIPGRVDSGKMLRAFKYRTTTQGGSRQLRVGWVSGTREDYFKAQEGGFEHPYGITVEGMHALQDAGEAALVELFRQLKDSIHKS